VIHSSTLLCNNRNGEDTLTLWKKALQPYTIQENFYESFKIKEVLGSGSFGKVILATKLN
jgi:hypothetical protein